jgi:hypothetical protein
MSFHNNTNNDGSQPGKNQDSDDESQFRDKEKPDKKQSVQEFEQE